MKNSASYASLSLKAVEKERNQDNTDRESIFFLLGTVALILVVVLWSFSSALTNQVLKAYNEPFVVTVASCLSFMSYFVFLVLPDPLIYILQQKKKLEEEREREAGREEELASLDEAEAGIASPSSSSSSTLPAISCSTSPWAEVPSAKSPI